MNELPANNTVLQSGQRRGHERFLRLDSTQNPIDLLDELEAEPDLLVLVPSSGLIELLLPRADRS